MCVTPNLSLSHMLSSCYLRDRLSLSFLASVGVGDRAAATAAILATMSVSTSECFWLCASKRFCQHSSIALTELARAFSVIAVTMRNHRPDVSYMRTASNKKAVMETGISVILFVA